MTERRPDDPNEPPEDVVNLFSWANLRGAKYKDFSASRALSREKALQQTQQEMQHEREQALRDAEAQQAEAARLAAEAATARERALLAESAAQQAAQRAAQLAAPPEAPRMNPSSPSRGSQASEPENPFARLQPPTSPVPQQNGLPPEPSRSPSKDAHDRATPEAGNPDTPQPHRESGASKPVRTPWSGPEGRDLPSRPAWLTERRTASVAGQNPEDTLQGSRDRLTSRWFALKNVLEGGTDVGGEAAPPPSAAQAPVLAVFSLAGGVGKTSIVATLGRALSSRGERVLLVDTAAFGLLPFYFGARDQRPGHLRTFAPPANSGDTPVQMISFDPGNLPDQDGQDPLSAEIQQYSRGVSRVIVDLATASGATVRRILPLAPLILVPLLADMNSVVSVGSIDGFFERHSSAAGRPLLPYYVLNQFDPSLPLHLDVREVLREQLGERLLSFSLRRAPAVSEALAEGMSILDYAPNSTAAEDFGSLAGWVKSQSAPAMTGFRGVRWSER